MEHIFEELGVPKKYLKPTNKEAQFIGLVHRQWLKSLVKHSKLVEFIERGRFESWPTNDEVGASWTKVLICVFKKREVSVIPLPRIRTLNGDDPPLLFCQLMQYIHQTNYKNLWKEAYKKYTVKPETSKETQICLTEYNDVLREIIGRIYGCSIINTCDSNLNSEQSKSFDVHLNILPAVCAIETLNAIFVLHFPYLDHNLKDCVTFSPAILGKCYSKPLFIVYQLLQILKSMHDRSLTLGDISLSDIYLTEDMWIYVIPNIYSNIYIQESPKTDSKRHSQIIDCRKNGHKFDLNLRCESCGIKTYDKVQITDENLQELCQLWVEGLISNFTYITVLNKLSGRKLGDPNCHHVFPWVTDFASRCGKNWRDLKKSKYRLNKGDRQLDLTYEHSQGPVPHHVSDVLSSITYYVYMARRTPKSVLCKNVRTIWVPAEYPSSIQRMQEWTPDECIPEFFTDPTVFRSIHDDLDDLEVPTWCSGPEDFIERHREALESVHVSERLHHWIDLTFGYKLAGNAAVKAKNVCLHLVDDHVKLTKSGIVQIFTHPHPARTTASPFWNKTPPKIYINKQNKPRDRSNSPGVSLDVKSDTEEVEDAQNSSSRSPLALSRFLSRSRSSLHEEQNQKTTRSSSNHRSSSLGPKNASFTSHINKSKPGLTVPSASMSTGVIYLPKEYKPEQNLESLEKRHSFFSKTFHVEEKRIKSFEEKRIEEKQIDDCIIPNSFTNLIYSDNFAEKLRNKAMKTRGFTTDNRNVLGQKNDNQIVCNYSEIISTRRIRELQILGCLLVELFMSKQLRALGANDSNRGFDDRFKACLTVVRSCKYDIPLCISRVVELLLQPDLDDFKDFKYPSVTDLGLPPPSAHLLLEPLLHCVIPFPGLFPQLYSLVSSLKDFKNVFNELTILYHFDCDGEMCAEYENIERTKILFAQNIGECRVKTCARSLESFLEELDTTTDTQVVNILLPHLKELIDDPPTSVLAAWYLFDPICRVLGPSNSVKTLLESILKLYENEPNESTLPYYGKIAKLYHHSFLLRLMVRLGLRCFLENFVAPLVEAVGRYKDYDRVDFTFHTHSEKLVKKTSHLKTMDAEHMEASGSDDSSVGSERRVAQDVQLREPEMFELDEDKQNEDQLKSLMEHLELNVASDLPFNHSTAEEALDATVTETLDQLRSLEELNMNLSEEDVDIKPTSPTIPIPCKPTFSISCEVGSKKSDSTQYELVLESPGSGNVEQKKETKKRQDPKISDMSSDSLIWLSHRLGPVLTAKYLSRNLLKMLTLCYVGRDNLVSVSKDEQSDVEMISVVASHVLGDRNACKVLECLTSIAGLYGEQLILFQYIPHMSELIALCKRKLTPNLEGGLISCLSLLQHVIPYLSDSTLMDQLQDVILRNILHPIVRLLASTKYVFPSGFTARNVLARKYLDTLYVLSIRMGSDMTRTHLAVPALQRFFLIFEKIYPNDSSSYDNRQQTEESHYVEVFKDGSTTEWSIGGKPIHITDTSNQDLDTSLQLNETGLEELRLVFNSELAYAAYLPFLRHVGAASLDISLKNHALIKKLCQEYESNCPNSKFQPETSAAIPASSSIGSNIALIGNRIEVQNVEVESVNVDVLSLVSNRLENNSRHLRGNWLAYWEHEIGRSDKDTMFNFKQIKLQTFAGHTHSVKCLYVLDNENSFISGSRDKTVKLWSLRSQGDGGSVSGCQWTYTAHKKSVLSITFIESMRLVASCDSVVHIWDPFMGVNVGHLESARFPPVNVLKSLPAPSTLVFAATTEGTVRVIDTRTCSYVQELKVSLNPTGLIRCLAIAPSGAWVAAGQSSGSITVLDSRTGLVVSTWKAHEGEVLQLVAADDNTLVSSSLDQSIGVWNVLDGKFKFPLRGATEPVHCLNVYNNELISGTTANRIGVHTSIDMEASFSSTKLRSDAFKGLLTSMALLPLNRLLLLGADTGAINLLC